MWKVSIETTCCMFTEEEPNFYKDSGSKCQACMNKSLPINNTPMLMTHNTELTLLSAPKEFLKYVRQNRNESNSCPTSISMDGAIISNPYEICKICLSILIQSLGAMWWNGLAVRGDGRPTNKKIIIRIKWMLTKS